MVLGALGIILGAVIGSRLRRKMDLTKLSREQITSFNIKCIIKWTKKNQKKLDQLWLALIIERVSTHYMRFNYFKQIIIDSKILAEHYDKKKIKQTYKQYYIIQFINCICIGSEASYCQRESRRCLNHRSPPLSNSRSQIILANKSNYLLFIILFRIIYKTFNFYIPLIKIIKFGTTRSVYSASQVYFKLESLIFSPEVISMISSLAND
jgi:hypothetical protein